MRGEVRLKCLALGEVSCPPAAWAVRTVHGSVLRFCCEASRSVCGDGVLLLNGLSGMDSRATEIQFCCEVCKRQSPQ